MSCSAVNSQSYGTYNMPLFTFHFLICSNDNIFKLFVLYITKLLESYRVLKDGGLYILLSLHEPSKAMMFINKMDFNWRISHFPIPNPRYKPHEKDGSEFHHFFVLKKRRGDNA